MFKSFLLENGKSVLLEKSKNKLKVYYGENKEVEFSSQKGLSNWIKYNREQIWEPSLPS